jgi:hypothetical protein
MELHLDFGKPSTDGIPDAILEDHSADYWLVSWKPDAAGIIPMGQCLVRKDYLAEQYPEAVETWEAKQHKEKEQARQIESNFFAFARSFLERDIDEDNAQHAHCGVRCDQALLPGMAKHWGELRDCDKHPGLRVRKGCRVSHYTQESRTFDRPLIMTRGARVPVCEACASAALKEHGVGYRGCGCDSHWTCLRCREAELEKMAKTRAEKHTEGRCGQCGGEDAFNRRAEFCLCCEGWRTYAAL